MSDRTPLERDIETRELSRTPISIKLLILILLSGLIVVTLYAFHLKQTLIKKDQKIILMQEKSQNEKSQLLSEFRELRNRIKSENNNGDQNK